MLYQVSCRTDMFCLFAAGAVATAPHLCGPQCGPLFASYAHNDSCWRQDTQSFFKFDIQPHYHVGDACFGENDPSAPFYFNGMYHMMWQSHTQYQHVPKWNKAPAGQFGDTGISFGHAVSPDLANWRQVRNALWPDEWFTSVSVYDGSATVINGMPTIIAAGLTPNTTSVFCHARAVPANLSDPLLEDWVWDPAPLYCGNATNNLRPFDAPTSAWRSKLGQWLYQDGRGGVYVSDDGVAWRGANGSFPGGTVCDFFPIPRACDGCPAADASEGATGALPPTHVHEAANGYTLVRYEQPDQRDGAGAVQALSGDTATVASASALGLTQKCDHGTFGFPKSFVDPANRRLQYGWVQGPGLQGQEDAQLDGASYKVNHQSLVREVTYDKRLGMLNFLPVQETELLRRERLAQIDMPTAVPRNGVLPLRTPPTAANQSEVRVLFAMPTNVTTLQFGVRVMTSPRSVLAVPDGFTTNNETDLAGVDVPELDFKLAAGTNDEDGIAQCASFCANHSVCGGFVFVSGRPDVPTPGGPRCAIKAVGACRGFARGGCFSGYKNSACPHTPSPSPRVPTPAPAAGSRGLEFSISFTPMPTGAAAWAVDVNGGKAKLPLLATEQEIELLLYIDHTVVEGFFQRGRIALTTHVPSELLLPHGGNSVQGVEIFSTKASVTVLQATVWKIADIWDNVNTHGRPLYKP